MADAIVAVISAIVANAVGANIIVAVISITDDIVAFMVGADAIIADIIVVDAFTDDTSIVSSSTSG